MRWPANCSHEEYEEREEHEEKPLRKPLSSPFGALALVVSS
jgi:hypothetical protein